ncbi:metabolite-proton symporter [Bradyrhizobium sp. Rc3b]|uniref:MFS transporter n=1 Tax=Bradyrhizobium sp. Rc3b TaxID=1855322 RepID=UPI0008F1806D|nr:MFS transporter [Bradyrhizobium sp. Rc3b]SFN83148.1 metabolite-proton symporter [Bradyrhizobium sp. Rc3b]
MKSAEVSGRRHYVIAGLASMMGTTIEWYDFFLYGTAAALVFNKIFFPSFDPVAGTMAAFATYSVGFFARPLGGIVFGHFGDRIGRKSMLLITLVLMGVPTMAIGIIPSYESIGYWAAVLLVAMRFLQGVAVGGEWGGAVLMAVEHAPDDKKGLFGSLPQAGVAPGLILSSLAMSMVATLPEKDMLSWGWRLPFLASVVLLAVGWFIRVNVAESPDFERVKGQGDDVKVPIAEVCRSYPRAVLLAIGARFAEVTWFYTVSSFSLAYAVGTLGIPRTVILDATVWGAAVVLFTMPLFGLLGDRIGHKHVFMIGAVGIVIAAPIFFNLLSSKEVFWINVAMIIAIGLVYGCLYAPEGSLFSSQFPPEVRYTGISLAVQVSGALGGGLAPIVATWLLARNGGDPQYVVWYLTALAAIALLCAWCMRAAAVVAAHEAAGKAGVASNVSASVAL